MLIGYHASHEQFSPAALLDYATQAEEEGFQGIMSSDHSSPWSARQGESGFSWSWLGAAMQKTSLPFGALAIPIGYRYHPLLVAQACATLSDMFTDRLPWIAAGSGEALNEIMVGRGWVSKEERNRRLLAGVEMLRRLWRGETVSEQDGLIPAHQARLWTLPAMVPDILGAALTPDTARWAGAWADGLITVHMPQAEMKKICQAFYEGGGRGKKLVLQMQVAWAPDYQDALMMAFDQWKVAALPPAIKAELKTAHDFDKAAAELIPADIAEKMLILDDAGTLIDWIRAYKKMGFEEIYLHNACPNQREFIQFCGEQVLPYLTE